MDTPNSNRFTTSQVAEFFDREAENFPLHESSRRGPGKRIVDAVFRRSLRLRYERVMALCQPVEGSTVLDIGCGTGAYALSFARRRATRVVGLDIATRMIEVARQRAESHGAASRCEFHLAALEEFEVAEPFDFVIAMGVLDYVQDADAFIARAVGHTRRLACFSLPRHEGVLAWQRRLRYRRRCPLYMYRRKEVIAYFEKLGRPYQLERLARDWFVSVRCSG